MIQSTSIAEGAAAGSSVDVSAVSYTGIQQNVAGLDSTTDQNITTALRSSVLQVQLQKYQKVISLLRICKGQPLRRWTSWHVAEKLLLGSQVMSLVWPAGTAGNC